GGAGDGVACVEDDAARPGGAEAGRTTLDAGHVQVIAPVHRQVDGAVEAGRAEALRPEKVERRVELDQERVGTPRAVEGHGGGAEGGVEIDSLPGEAAGDVEIVRPVGDHAGRGGREASAARTAEF